MSLIDRIPNWLEYAGDKLRGKQRLFEIIPGLFITSEIRNPRILRDAGITVLVDLAGGFDTGELSSFLKYYLWVGGLEDKEEIPDPMPIKMAGGYAYCRHKEGLRVALH